MSPAPPGRRIGLFGGSFDPVHNAHLALARQARDELQLDELRWVPVGVPWQKSRVLTPGPQREAMLRLAIEGEPGFVVERCELQRPGPSYTVHTVRELQAAVPGAHWYLILGEDQYRNLHTWHGFEELLACLTLVVAQRAQPAASGQLDARVRSAECVRLALPRLPVSSSEIRARVAAGQDVGALVPPAVALYIRQHGLYRATGS